PQVSPPPGYGAASPRTQEGKIFCIFYGLIGCSSGILFFNLFLERIITLLAFIMRARHERKQRQRAAAGGVEGVVENNQRRGSQDSMEDSSLDAWKPSVYWVMFYLTLASVVRIASCCARGHCKPTPRRNAVSPSRLQKHAIKRLTGGNAEAAVRDGTDESRSHVLATPSARSRGALYARTSWPPRHRLLQALRPILAGPHATLPSLRPGAHKIVR
ncbi:Potassium channel subfamily K member 13-like 2, partial [Homarus americanus]